MTDCQLVCSSFKIWIVLGFYALGHAQSLPTNWRSLMSGKTSTLRLSDDHLYIEGEVPPEQKSRGAFALGDLEKQPDGTFRGTMRTRLFGVYTTGAEAWLAGANATFGNKAPVPVHVQGCTFEFAMEVRVMTASRIEGRTQVFPPQTKVDVKKCKPNKQLVWLNFVWIPE